jgi:hypothetical protein
LSPCTSYSSSIAERTSLDFSDVIASSSLIECCNTYPVSMLSSCPSSTSLPCHGHRLIVAPLTANMVTTTPVRDRQVSAKVRCASLGRAYRQAELGVGPILGADHGSRHPYPSPSLSRPTTEEGKQCWAGGPVPPHLGCMCSMVIYP